MNLFSNYRVSCKRLTWQGVLEDARVLKSLCIRLILVLTDGLTKEWCIATHLFLRDCMRISRKSGLLHLALYLKMCRVILMKFVAGDNPPEVIEPSVSLTRGGLPRIIPTFHRKKIRQGDLKVVQLYLSLFSLSRMIQKAKKVSKTLFKTIIEPNDLDSVKLVSSEMRGGLRALLTRYVPGIRNKALNQGLKFVPTWKSVPSTKSVRELLRRTSPDGYRPFTAYETQKSIFTCFFSELAAFTFLMTFVHSREEGYSQGCLWPPVTRYPFDSSNEGFTHSSLDWFEKRIGPLLPTVNDLGIELATGRLSQSLSGDGKRRLFAIGNYINQRLLHPVHEFLMSVLKVVPMDGTFHQTGPLDRLCGVTGTVHSVDLKAATDRWPLLLLFDIMSAMFGRSFASASVNSCLATNIFTPSFTNKKVPVSFIAGQPLGYYSSWPLFALSHHVMVWHSAEQVYPGKRFDKYAVLGDDIVIADQQVVDAYRSLLARIGVAVSPSKTLTSPKGACEFAKKFRVNRMTEDISPVSLKALAEARTPLGFYGLLGALDRFPLRDSTLLRISGLGFKAASRALSSPHHKRRARQVAVMLLHWRFRHLEPSLRMTIILGKVVPPEVCGSIRSRLLKKYEPRDIILPPDAVFAYPGMRDFNEYSLYQGWVKQYLLYLKWYAELINPVHYRLDFFQDAPVYYREWHAKDPDKERVGSFGVTFMVYNWASQHMKHPNKLVTAYPEARVLHGRDFVVFLSVD